MSKKRKEDGRLKAVASVMQVIGKLTGDETLSSKAALRIAAVKASPTPSEKTSETT